MVQTECVIARGGHRFKKSNTRSDKIKNNSTHIATTLSNLKPEKSLIINGGTVGAGT